MNNDFLELYKKTAGLQAALGPLRAWHKIYSGSAIDLHNKYKLPASTFESAVTQLFKNHHTRNLQLNSAIAAMLPNPSIWATINSISANQKSIASLLSKNLVVPQKYTSLQAATASFASEINSSIFGYNSKLANLQSVWKSIGSRIAVEGFKALDEELLEDFQETTKEAASISKEFVQTEYASKESIIRLEEFIETTLKKLDEKLTTETGKKPKSLIEKLNLWVGIFGIIFGIVQILQTCTSQQQVIHNSSISKEDFEQLKKHVELKFDEIVQKSTQQAKLRIRCHLRQQPSSKSKGFFKIENGQIVNIISTNHKWVQVTTIDPKDGLPIIGWVLRKYVTSK